MNDAMQELDMVAVLEGEGKTGILSSMAGSAA